MTDFAAENAAQVTPGALTERSGAAVGVDTVPAGALLLFRNTGAGTHNVTIVTNNTVDGLAISDLSFALTAGQIKAGRVKSEWGDANGRVNVWVQEGTTTEVKYYVLGGA